jgi:flavin-binding protein dodecin
MRKPCRPDRIIVADRPLADSVATARPRRARSSTNTEAAMEDHIYRVIQIVGSSEKSIDDAIQRAVSRASKTLRDLRWFEVVETRGHIEGGKVHHFQVTLKVGFTLEED